VPLSGGVTFVKTRSELVPDAPRTPAWESVAIILSILALFPKIWVPHRAYSDWLMYAALVTMVVVLIRKILRFRALWKQQEKR
jgi:hypothetical protein